LISILVFFTGFSKSGSQKLQLYSEAKSNSYESTLFSSYCLYLKEIHILHYYVNSKFTVLKKRELSSVQKVEIGVVICLRFFHGKNKNMVTKKISDEKVNSFLSHLKLYQKIPKLNLA